MTATSPVAGPEAAPPSASGRIVAALASIPKVIADFGMLVLVDPVRHGRLRADRWPRGLAPVGVIALVAYAVAAVAIVTAGSLRAVSEVSASPGTSQLSFPQIAVGPLLALVVLALALAQTAALHTPMWLTVAMTVLTTLVLVSIGANDVQGEVPVGRVVSGVAAGCVWALVIVRRRRTYAWGEFAVVFGAISAGVAVPFWIVAQRSAAFGLEIAPVTLASTMQNIAALAVPVSVAAGAAVAQLSCAMATESVTSMRRHLPLGLGVAVLAALVIWRTWAVVAAAVDGDIGRWQGLVVALLLVAVVAGCWVALGRLRQRGSGRGGPGPGGPSLAPAALEANFGRIAQPLAMALTIGVFPATILYIGSGVVYTYTFADGPAQVLSSMADWLSQESVVAATRIVVGFGLIALSVRDARRGRDVSPELFVALGLVIISQALFALLGLAEWAWTGTSVTVAVTVAAVLMLIWLVLRRSLTVERGAALGVTFLLAALFDQRTFVEDPLRVFFGFTGFAFILFGFVWAVLTGAERANGTSRRYPRSARVLLFLANALFGLTVVAFSALARDPSTPIDLAALTAFGDRTLGNGLLAAALLAALATVFRSPKHAV
ncbi:hypothetical protein [Microbacterium rhizomatis]|uniref:hypothetical protein n=1 Tax=Microbacterium rhizomatis TaxID=1631477 RepID=UPI00147908FB|nr:hypothetical protein [Microbacterium rhizomatis]